MNNGQSREVTFNITERIGVLSTSATGWKKELNIVSWNGNPPKYDIRDWSPDYLHMSRGVTLHEQEMNAVYELIRRRRPEYKSEPVQRSNSMPVSEPFEAKQPDRERTVSETQDPVQAEGFESQKPDSFELSQPDNFEPFQPECVEPAQDEFN